MRARASHRPLILVALAGAVALAGCGGCDAPPRDLPKGAAVDAAAPPPEEPPEQELMKLVDELPGCDLEHRGLLFDAGAGALPGRVAWEGPVNAAPHPLEDQVRSSFAQAPALTGVQAVEHDGSTWARISERQIKLTFALPEGSPIFVSLRAEGLAARSVTVSLDDFVMGTLRLQRDQIRIASTGTTSLPVDPGLHTLTLRFSGRGGRGEAFADIDWIRVGVPDELPTSYGAPTLRDVVAPGAALGGVPHRAISLRAP
ncbi:MAG TPA: hypothetical protein VLS89_09465, partial [Candidatus Nanopelagicales bacterium]|nr:hypothetical protein [Candidatus Nanopelagicales bacterium]